MRITQTYAQPFVSYTTRLSVNHRTVWYHYKIIIMCWLFHQPVYSAWINFGEHSFLPIFKTRISSLNFYGDCAHIFSGICLISSSFSVIKTIHSTVITMKIFFLGAPCFLCVRVGLCVSVHYIRRIHPVLSSRRNRIFLTLSEINWSACELNFVMTLKDFCSRLEKVIFFVAMLRIGKKSGDLIRLLTSAFKQRIRVKFNWILSYL